MSIIDPRNPFSAPQAQEQEQANILTPGNITSPEQFMQYVMHDMQMLVHAYEQSKGSLMVLLAKLNQMAAKDVQMENRIVFLETYIRSLGVDVPNPEVPPIPEQSQQVLDDYAKAKAEAEAALYEPHPNTIPDPESPVFEK